MEHFEKIIPVQIYNQFRVKNILVEVGPDFITERHQKCTIEYNTDTSAGHPVKDDDIVRYSEETQRVQDKELEH